MWVLIGEGPNDVSIPALVWSDKNKALETCINNVFDREPDEKSGEGNAETFGWRSRGRDDDLGKALEKMYTSYYGGCGGCYSAVLQYVEEGKPFVVFNLD